MEATEAAAEATAKERDRRRPLTIYGARGGGARKRDEVLDVLNFETQKEEGREEGGRKRFLVSFRISWRTLIGRCTSFSKYSGSRIHYKYYEYILVYALLSDVDFSQLGCTSELSEFSSTIMTSMGVIMTSMGVMSSSHVESDDYTMCHELFPSIQ